MPIDVAGARTPHRIARAVGRCIRLLPLLLLLAAGGALGGDGIYGYTDEDGVAHFSNVPESGAYRLILRGGEERRQRGGARTNQPATAVGPDRPYAEEIEAAAGRFGLEPALLHAVIAVESNYDPAARSAKGAIGLMQLMPGTSRRFGVGDPWRPRENIDGGARYLSGLLALFDNDLALTLAAYNAGEEAVLRHGRRVPPYRETRDYVRRVLASYRRQLALAAPGDAGQHASGRSL